MIKKIFAIFLCFLFAFLVGCTGYTESDSRYIISAIGFEKLDGEFSISAQAVTANEGDDKLTQSVYTAKGESLNEALSSLKARLSKPLSFEHCSAVILSSALKGEAVKAICEFCSSLNRLNTSVYFGVCDKIEELISFEALSEKAGGYDISSSIETKEEISGLSYKNRLYEILSSKEDFIPTFNLPFFTVTDEEFFIDGQCVYIDFAPQKKLNQTQSLVYSILTNQNSKGDITLSGKTAVLNSSHTYFSAKLQGEQLYITLNTSLSFKEKDEGFLEELNAAANSLLSEPLDIFGFSKISEQKHSKVFDKIKDNYASFYSKRIIKYNAQETVK